MKKKLSAMLTIASMLLTMLPSLAFAGEMHDIKPGDIVKGSEIDFQSGDEIVAGLGEYQYGTDPTRAVIQDISWIVLDPEQTNVGKDGMFLISKNVIGDSMKFDTDGNQAYQNSDIQRWCTGFYDTKLKKVDKGLGNAIIATNKTDKEYTTQQWNLQFNKTENILNGDKVFLPSAQEIDNDYMWKGKTGNDERKASGADYYWWLRSPYSNKNNYAGFVNYWGDVEKYDVTIDLGGVRPALNLNPKSLIFKSIEDGKYKIGNIKVDFNSQGGTDVQSDITYKGGKIAEPVAPTKEGFAFKGWYNAEEGGTKIHFNTSTFDADIILYAQWMKIIEPGDIVTSDELKAGDEIVAGLGTYEYGGCDCSYDYDLSKYKCATHGDDGIKCGTQATPISWIILDPEKTNTGEVGMFLISKNILGYEMVFSAGDNDYQSSNVKTWCDNFYNDVLHGIDENLGNVIISTTKSDEEYISQECEIRYAAAENILNGDKVFLPSAQEIDKDYIWKGEAGNDARRAAGATIWWWLRSADCNDKNIAGDIYYDGEVLDYYVDYGFGVRPALNLNPESLRFKCISEGKYELLGGDVPNVRYAGANRYDTSIKVADALKKEMGVDTFDCIVVATGDNYPDALASGYLAKVNDAPLILTSTSQESATAKYIRENLKENGKIYLIGGTGAVSTKFEATCKGITSNVTRLGGTDRYDTNMKILKETGVDDEDLLVCSGAGYADSLSASAAGKPIFLVGKSLTAEQKEYLNNLNTSKYYAIGGTGVVSEKVFDEVCAIKTGAQHERVAGATRYETSAAVASKFFNRPNGEGSYVMLAYAQNFPDGLAGSALACSLDAPLLLTDNTQAGIAAAKGYVESVGATYSVTLGGTKLISDASRDKIMGRNVPK